MRSRSVLLGILGLIVFVSSVALLESRPDVAKNLLDAHREPSAWIGVHEWSDSVLHARVATADGRRLLVDSS